DYADVSSETQSFIIIRHDVEFSPKRAHDLAELEHNEGITSTYFFQISNHSYNILSRRNIDRILAIHEMGHRIGLHFHLNGSDNLQEIRSRIIYECGVMSQVLNIKIDRFSFHRPSRLVLENVIDIPGLINAYNPLYFSYIPEPSQESLPEVKYIADSRSEWSYTAPYIFPDDEFFRTYRKVQMLCHPYTWTPEGLPVLENLRLLIAENRKEFIETLDSETKYVRNYLNAL
ncbi:MAG: hypothetical protein IJP54_00425, partial [Synergistaceae bacterium]|nr:hypothetical protein [Synergistaceae bacterium]